MAPNNTSNIPFQASSPASPPSPSSTTFSITTPSTQTNDVWRKPANASSPNPIDVFNAPKIWKAIPLSTFQRARVTVSAAWASLYDQGGLVFVLPAAAGAPENERKWIKTGIEFYLGEPYVSTVVCDRFADWSLVKTGVVDGKVTIEVERDAKEGTLWVYVVLGEGGKRVPVREVTWILSESPKERELWVGVYAASPTVEGREKGLEVSYEGWEFEVVE